MNDPRLRALTLRDGKLGYHHNVSVMFHCGHNRGIGIPVSPMATPEEKEAVKARAKQDKCPECVRREALAREAKP